MFCGESLGKIEFRAFPKRVGPRILSLASVGYMYLNFHGFLFDIVMSMRFIFGDD